MAPRERPLFLVAMALDAESMADGVPVALRYRWIGREFDAETGFYFLRARYYDPQSQRFIQEDAIGYAGGSNLYAYGDANPTNGRDLDGLSKDYEYMAYVTGPNPYSPLSCYGTIAGCEVEIVNDDLEYWFAGGGIQRRAEEVLNAAAMVVWIQNAAAQVSARCGSGKCPSVRDVLNSLGMFDLFAEIMARTLRTGNEHGTWITIGASGRLYYQPIMEGNESGIPAMQGPPPPNAVARVHSHPDAGLAPGWPYQSGVDRASQNAYRIIDIILSSRGIYVRSTTGYEYAFPWWR